MKDRRTFLKSVAGAMSLGELGFLGKLPAVSAAEAKLPPDMVRFGPEMEALVRLLEDTSRERVLEEVAARVRRGLSYREVLAALMLAGVRSVQPRPVGFKFHAVLVVNSAHLASLASPDEERWLPIFWAIDQFKSSQAVNVNLGAGADIFRVQSTTVVGSSDFFGALSVLGGAGADTLTLGGNTASTHGVKFRNAVTLDGGTETDSYTVGTRVTFAPAYPLKLKNIP